MRVQLLGSFNKEDAYEKAMQKPEEYISIFTKDESDIYDPDVKATEISDNELVMKGNFLHIDDVNRQKYLFFKENVGFKLYKILPNVKESKVFHWKELASSRSCTRRLWAQVRTSLIRFNITYRTIDDSASISAVIGSDTVKYMSLENATNERLINMINLYIVEFMQKAESMQTIEDTDNN